MASPRRSEALRPKDQKAPKTTPVTEAKTEDQTATKAGDQKDATTPKKVSAKVTEWRDANKAKLYRSGTIMVSTEAKAKNPKRNKDQNKPGAASRFALYRDGMSVAEYVSEVNEVKKYASKAQAQSDVVWDVVHGFISLS